jgi:hypothetical protein
VADILNIINFILMATEVGDKYLIGMHCTRNEWFAFLSWDRSPSSCILCIVVDMVTGRWADYWRCKQSNGMPQVPLSWRVIGCGVIWVRMYIVILIGAEHETFGNIRRFLRFGTIVLLV